MYPTDRSEMSPARARMMARRRNSLTALAMGALACIALALTFGGSLWWALALVFLGSLAGYLYFLRTQALRDRERRETRRKRAEARQGSARGYDSMDFSSTDEDGEDDDEDGTVVRIDDDDPSLQHMDTVDLTGLYSAGDFAQPSRQRRAG